MPRPGSADPSRPVLEEAVPSPTDVVGGLVGGPNAIDPRDHQGPVQRQRGDRDQRPAVPAPQRLADQPDAGVAVAPGQQRPQRPGTCRRPTSTGCSASRRRASSSSSRACRARWPTQQRLRVRTPASTPTRRWPWASLTSRPTRPGRPRSPRSWATPRPSSPTPSPATTSTTARSRTSRTTSRTCTSSTRTPNQDPRHPDGEPFTERLPVHVPRPTSSARPTGCPARATPTSSPTAAARPSSTTCSRAPTPRCCGAQDTDGQVHPGATRSLDATFTG